MDGSGALPGERTMSAADGYEGNSGELGVGVVAMIDYHREEV
jgi:hypothetical protein